MLFDTYRAKELAEVQSVGNYRIRVSGMGEDGTFSKHLTITPTELEKIIEVLEPEDYRKATEGL